MIISNTLNYKGADQTVRQRRLVCALVVRKFSGVEAQLF